MQHATNAIMPLRFACLAAGSTDFQEDFHEHRGQKNATLINMWCTTIGRASHKDVHMISGKQYASRLARPARLAKFDRG